MNAYDDASEGARRLLTQFGEIDLAEMLVATRAQLALLHEGEEPYIHEHTVTSPAQWIWQWNRITPARRLKMAEQAIRGYADAQRCRFEGHARRLDEDRQVWVALARVGDVIADMESITGARHWARILRTAIDGDSGAAPWGVVSTPVHLTDEEADALRERLIKVFAALEGRPMRFHADGTYALPRIIDIRSLPNDLWTWACASCAAKADGSWPGPAEAAAAADTDHPACPAQQPDIVDQYTDHALIGPGDGVLPPGPLRRALRALRERRRR